MPRLSRLFRLLTFLAVSCLTSAAQQPAVNAAQQLVFAGLRSVHAKGQIAGLATDAAGNIYLALDQGDGVRVLEVAGDGTTVLNQIQLGAAGDSAVALALDPAGNVYVTGTSTSGRLAATAGAAIGQPTAGTTNSFVAKFDSSLDEVFLTFTGGSRIAASALAASGDAVFVTGITYGSDLPVTGTAIEQAPAYGSLQNGFIEQFSGDGKTLVYATYLTGALGDTTPTGIAVDALDDAWIVGSTSASGAATVNALIPNMLSTPSGFLVELTPAGDGFDFATFVPGPGLNSIALDSTGQTLLIGGAIDPGQFPVDTVLSPFVAADYQVLLRMPLDGSGVLSSTLIAQGSQSVVAPGADGSAWIAGTFAPGSIPQLPQPAFATIGNGFAVHVTQSGGIDQVIRLGGIANQQQTYAAIPLTLNALAIDPSGNLIVGGSAQPTASANLLPSETYDLPLLESPTPAFPSGIADAEASAATCGGSLCSGSAAYLAKFSVSASLPGLVFSTGDLPLVTLRNLGSSPANSLQLATTGGTLATDCPATLDAGGECSILLQGGTPGTLTATAGADAIAYNFPAFSPAAAEDSIAVSPKELDFGVQTAAGTPPVATLTLTNLSQAAATFNAGLVTAPKTTPLFVQQTGDCPQAATPGALTLAAGASCRLGIVFSPSAATGDGFVTGEWTVGSRQVMLTGYAQAAALSVSSTELNFGTVFEGTASVPRYLYLSNDSSGDIAHTPVALPSSSPFSVTDGCPATIRAASVCRIRVDYDSTVAPSSDSSTLQLDRGLSVVLAGSTLPPPGAGGSTVSPSLSVSPLTATFGDAVVVTGVSAATIDVGIVNSGASDLPLALALSGDFIQTTSCSSVLAAGATCAVALQFTPSQPGLRQGLLSVSSGTGTAAVDVALSGEGAAILAANNGALAFASVPVGQPSVQFYKVSQPFGSLSVATTGPYSATLIEDTGYGHGEPAVTQFAASTTATCHNCWVAVRFLPVATGAQNGTIAFSSTPLGQPYGLDLQGAGLATSGLILSPAQQDFGTVPANSASGALPFTLTNGTPAAITVGSIASGTTFPLSNTGGPVCAGSLAPGASCSVEVAFAPAAAGGQSGQLTIQTSAGAVSAALTGNATADPGVGISPLSLTFANTSGPAATSQQVTVQNTGSNPVVVGTPTAGTPSFAATSACGTLARGASCAIQVQFMPGSQPASDVLSIPVTAQNSGGNPSTTIYTVGLSGTYTGTSAGLQIAPASIAFGTAPTSSLGATRQFTVGNSTQNSLALTIHLPQSYLLVGQPCTMLASGATCSFSVQFAPAIDGDIAGTVEVDAVPADGSAPLSTLAYTEGYGVGSGSVAIGGGLIVNGVYSFGQPSPGQTATHTFTLTNPSTDGSAAPIHLRRIISAPPFQATNTCGSPLASGASCTVTVTYAPTASTAANPPPDVGSLNFDSDTQSTPASIYLTGQSGASGATASTMPVAAYTLSQGSLTFPPVSVGDSSALSAITLTNTGTVLLHVGSVTSTTDFQVQNGCSVVAIGGTCSLAVASTPQTTGDHLATLEIASDAADNLEYVSLFSIGTSPALAITPAALNFGTVLVGATAQLPLQISNMGASPVTFNSLQPTAGFSAGGNCPASGGSLAAQASCTVQVTFTPAAAGNLDGSLTISTSASTHPLTVPITGQGIVPQLAASPAALNFGAVALGSSSVLPVTLTNTGASAVTALSLTATGDFAVTTPCPSTTLMPGASCQAQIAFSPTAVGARTGTLAALSSDPTSPLAIPLSGIGTTPPGFALTVNGAAAASLSVQSGQFATFDLAVTPSGGFTGAVALTCAPAGDAPYASCSLLPPLVDLAGGLTSPSTATVNTLYSGNGVARTESLELAPRDRPALAILLPGLILLLRRRSTRFGRGVGLSALLLTFFIAGCGGSGPSNLHYTPAGTYEFIVTANSTGGTQISQTVVLTVVVTPR